MSDGLYFQIRVLHDHDIPCRVGKSGLQRFSLSTVRSMVEDLDLRIQAGEFFGDVPGPVARAIIDNHHFVKMRDRKDLLRHGDQRRLFVKGRNDDDKHVDIVDLRISSAASRMYLPTRRVSPASVSARPET